MNDETCESPLPRDVCQEDIFLGTAGDGYFDRNYSDAYEESRLASDRIVSLHGELQLAPPARMLEIGCMTGFRCELFRRVYGSQASGVEPSAKAVALGRQRYPQIRLEVGVVTKLPFSGETFDCIVLGNFMYWLDRDSLFIAAQRIDAALADGGILYMLDFDPQFAHKNVFVHNPGCFTYKMHHYKMFSWNPIYTIIHQTYYHLSHYNFKTNRSDCSQITVLHKNRRAAFDFARPAAEK